MNKRQKGLVRKLIKEYDETYVEEGLRSRVDDYQSEARHVARQKVDIARSLLGFRSETALRRAVGIKKKAETDF